MDRRTLEDRNRLSDVYSRAWTRHFGMLYDLNGPVTAANVLEIILTHEQAMQDVRVAAAEMGHGDIFIRDWLSAARLRDFGPIPIAKLMGG